MALVTIRCSCGHRSTSDFASTGKLRQEIIASAEKQPCPECQEARERREKKRLQEKTKTNN